MTGDGALVLFCSVEGNTCVHPVKLDDASWLEFLLAQIEAEESWALAPSGVGDMLPQALAKEPQILESSAD